MNKWLWTLIILGLATLGLRYVNNVRQEGQAVRALRQRLADPNERQSIIQDRLLRERLRETVESERVARRSRRQAKLDAERAARVREAELAVERRMPPHKPIKVEIDHRVRFGDPAAAR